MAPYHRTSAQKQADLAEARAFETQVAAELGRYVVDRTDSLTEIDFCVPGYYLDVKEKRQPLSPRWHILPGVEERDLVVVDELGFRKLMRHWPAGYFLIRDVPGNRLFVASCVTLACVERARVNRVGKGKLVLNLQQFLRIGSIDELDELVMRDLMSEHWNQSAAVGQVATPEVQR